MHYEAKIIVDGSLVGLMFAYLVTKGEVHGMELHPTNSSYISKLRYEYLRTNYPVKHIQEVVHINGQPTIVDLIVVVKREE